MNSITIPSKVHNGTLVNNKGKINKAIKHFEGKEIEIVVKQRKKLRSHPQNSYYFGVIIPLTINAVSNEWGEIWDAHKTHDFFKTMFLYEEVTHYDTGEVIKIPKSSTDNSTIQQEQYHLKCIEFLKEWFNVYVPLPNEHLKNKLMKKINYRKLYESHYNILIPEGYELHHIDADRTNNNISNLIDLPKEFHKALHNWVGLIPRKYICHLLDWYLSQDKSFSPKALGYYLQVQFKKINTSKSLEIECKKYLRKQKWNQGMSAYTNGY